jgi:hypothetical protein
MSPYCRARYRFYSQTGISSFLTRKVTINFRDDVTINFRDDELSQQDSLHFEELLLDATTSLQNLTYAK